MHQITADFVILLGMDENPPVLSEAVAQEALSRLGLLKRVSKRPTIPAVDPVWAHVAAGYTPPSRTSATVCRKASGPATGGGGRICNPVAPDPCWLSRSGRSAERGTA